MTAEVENHSNVGATLAAGPDGPLAQRGSSIPPGQKPLWGGARETIIWVLFCLILAAGAFGWGYIYKDHRVDDLREQVHKLDGKQKDMNGRLIVIEGKKK